METYNDLYQSLRKRLEAEGVEAAALEARLLTAAAAEKPQAELLRDLRLPAPAGVKERLRQLAERRLSGEPLAYLLGSWDFFGLEFAVDRRVLIPRSDTELLPELALECLEGVQNPRLLDLCAGSGCIGCAIAANRPDASAVLLDRSPGALAVAERNLRRLGLSRRAECVPGDALAAPPAGLGGFDLIVSNPPYVPSGELAGLDASVRDFEPAEALDGGPDGLRFYRSILEGWTGLLNRGGWLLFETGEDQAGRVAELMSRAGLREISLRKDTLGYNRAAAGRKP